MDVTVKQTHFNAGGSVSFKKANETKTNAVKLWKYDHLSREIIQKKKKDCFYETLLVSIKNEKY